MNNQTHINNPSQKVLVLSGSLKAASVNQKLAVQAGKIALSLGAEVTTISLRDYNIPLFNEDIEQEEHAAVNDIRATFAAADALIIASPEYNGSLTPALKNVIDWVSRPNAANDYAPRYSRQKAALLSASPGGLGGLRGLTHLREVLTNLGTLVIPSQLAVPAAYDAFNENDELINAATKDRLQAIIDQLLKVTIS